MKFIHFNPLTNYVSILFCSHCEMQRKTRVYLLMFVDSTNSAGRVYVISISVEKSCCPTLRRVSACYEKESFQFYNNGYNLHFLK